MSTSRMLTLWTSGADMENIHSCITDWRTRVHYQQRTIITDLFSGPGSAIRPLVCVRVCSYNNSKLK